MKLCIYEIKRKIIIMEKISVTCLIYWELDRGDAKICHAKG